MTVISRTIPNSATPQDTRDIARLILSAVNSRMGGTRTVAADYAVTDLDELLFVTEACSVTLPAASMTTLHRWISNIGTGNVPIVCDGVTLATLGAGTTAFMATDGTAWRRLV